MHTPGPWKPVYNTDYMYEPDPEDLEDKYLVSIEGANGKTVYYTDSGFYRPNLADVSLIAAAPDLLEALELLADKARTWHDSECAVPFGACDCRADEEDKAVQIALAAIAKAKGE